MLPEIDVTGWPSVLVGLTSGALAFVIYFSRPDRAQNVAAALYVGGWGVGWGVATGLSFFFLPHDIPSFFAGIIVAHVLWSLPMAMHPWLLATLDTPLTWPFRPLAVRLFYVAAFTLLAAAIVLWPGLFYYVGDCGVGPLCVGPLRVPWNAYATLMWLYAAVCAVHAYHRTTSPRLKRQAFWFAVAFVTYDVINGVWLGLGLLGYFLPDPTIWAVPITATVLMSGLLAYGILRAQLFDIDLKIKWTIRRGSLAGAFLAVFFVASAIAEQYLQQYGVVAGGAAVGLLLFAFRPLERAADRFANAAMPGVGGEEYEAYRKVEVYKGALEEMMLDGALSPRDRTVLDGIRRRLGLSETAAHAIALDLEAARGRAGA